MLIGIPFVIAFIIEIVKNHVVNLSIENLCSLLFVAVGCYCWYTAICDLIKPKEKVLYLNAKKENVYEFLTKKGKALYFTSNNNYKIKQFYKVLKTKNNISNVIGISNQIFDIPNLKKSYWLNFYTPFGNFEDLFLLPIAYFILLVGIVVFINCNEIQKIIAFTFILVIIGFIVYDFIYKHKLKKNKSLEELNELENTASKSFDTLYNIIQLIVALALNVILWGIFIKVTNSLTSVALIPFCICAIAALIQIIGIIFKHYRLSSICKKICICSILLYMFGFLVIWCYYAIKEEMYGILIFTIPFLIVGIYIISKLIKGEIE